MAVGSLSYVVNDGAVRRITEAGPDVSQVLFVRSCGLARLFLGAAATIETVGVGNLRVSAPFRSSGRLLGRSDER